MHACDAPPVPCRCARRRCRRRTGRRATTAWCRWAGLCGKRSLLVLYLPCWSLLSSQDRHAFAAAHARLLHCTVQAGAGSPTLVDCTSLPGVVRIDMLPGAVAKRLSHKALSLLDGPLPAGAGTHGRTRSASPPGTPK